MNKHVLIQKSESSIVLVEKYSDIFIVYSLEILFMFYFHVDCLLYMSSRPSRVHNSVECNKHIHTHRHLYTLIDGIIKYSVFWREIDASVNVRDTLPPRIDRISFPNCHNSQTVMFYNLLLRIEHKSFHVTTMARTSTGHQ